MPPRLDTKRVARLLSTDVANTLSDGLVSNVQRIAANVQMLALADQFRSADDAQRYFDQKVVDDFQQFVHDQRIDTEWPACPLHPNHPLDYHESTDAWCCAHDGVAIGRLGELHLVDRRPI